jgi:hypothetical protein
MAARRCPSGAAWTQSRHVAQHCWAREGVAANQSMAREQGRGQHVGRSALARVSDLRRHTDTAPLRRSGHLFLVNRSGRHDGHADEANSLRRTYINRLLSLVLTSAPHPLCHGPDHPLRPWRLAHSRALCANQQPLAYTRLQNELSHAA